MYFKTPNIHNCLYWISFKTTVDVGLYTKPLFITESI